jgi:hypothetical protein
MTGIGKVGSTYLALIVFVSLAACGLYTPDKDPFTSDAPIGPQNVDSRQGGYENSLVDHITCEISQALRQAKNNYDIPWLYKDWGAAVTLSMTVEDQTGLSPGLSFIQPLQNGVFSFPTGGNVVSPEAGSFNWTGHCRFEN